MRGGKRWAILLAGAGAATLATAAMAAETIVYRYDARGRLVRIERSVSVNSNVATDYSYDKADNRVVKSTTGSTNPPPP